MAQQYFYGFPAATQQFPDAYAHYAPFPPSPQARQMPFVCLPPRQQHPYGSHSYQRQHQQYRRSFSAPADAPTAMQPPAHLARGATARRAFWHPLHPYKYDWQQNCWAEAGSIDAAALRVKKKTITVVTYNVLFDIYFKELLHTEQRMAAMFALLQASDADIIGLQEVTQPFLEKLLDQEWVKQSYYVSDSKAGITVLPYGQIILSRFPFYNLTVHKYSLYKRVVMGEFLANGRKIFVPVVHLSSNRSKDNGDRRTQQLRVIYDRVQRDNEDADCFLLGDFNFGDGEETDKNIPLEFKDVWLTLRPDDQGCTFDQHNTLATLTAGTGLHSSRFDRVLIRSKRGCWRPKEVEMIGNQPFFAASPPASPSEEQMGEAACSDDSDSEVEQNASNGADATILPSPASTSQGPAPAAEPVVLYPSDHYGVKAVIEFVDGERARKPPRH